MKRNMFPIALLGAMCVCVPGAMAQDLDFSIDTKTSNAAINATTSVDASGFLIGDYDAETNPDGTQTRAGLFGGSGNQSIDTLTVLESSTMLDAMPAGSMNIVLDTLNASGEISGFMIDLLNGDAASTDLTVTVGFDTFRTFDPSFLYLGGIPITLPLGEVGSISSATLTQSGDAFIALSPADLPEAFEVTGVIPAMLDMSVALGLPGGEPTEFPIEDLPVLVPISGQLEVFGNGNASLTLSATPDPIMNTIPLEGIDLPEIPFELPTLGEETAGVLFTLSPQSIAFDASIGLTINALGAPAACPADLTGDGNLDFFDISAFLAAYTAMDPAADFDGNGVYDFFDVSSFLGAFSAGCP
ncbi:MAG: GC-type dockerin domain-anchored protein [Phycisphaerales bacterium JB047]